MKVIVIRTPKLLSKLFRVLFNISKDDMTT